MRYLGGKNRQASVISTILQQHRKHNQIYLEPFVGAANVVSRMDGVCIASDIHPDLIALLRAIQGGWIPPENVTRAQYELYKDQPDQLPPALRAFVGFGCSFGGKWFGGYAAGESRNYAAESRRSLLQLKSRIQHVAFMCCDYRELNPHHMLIYCDPPYANTTEYGYSEASVFNSYEFWSVMKQWVRQDNTVIVSEYTAPIGVEEVYRWDKKTTLMHTGEAQDRVDKLFLVHP
jgi:DNA adenine methylase